MMGRRWRSLLMAVALVASLAGCATMRGRADDAYQRGDYRAAADLYAQLLAKDPSDGYARKRLALAERAIVDRILDAMDAARAAGREAEALEAGLTALEARDRAHAGSIDEGRVARIASATAWAGGRITARVEADASAGRALSARATKAWYARWLARAELATLPPRLDAAIAKAGVETCARATTKADDQPFALALVASYCKAFGGPPPPWRARPILVGGLVLRGRVDGVPADEHAELERLLRQALAGSVWFAGASKDAAAVDVGGAVEVAFSQRPTQVAKEWTEQVPYEASEDYQEAVEVPYTDTETYAVDVPYEAYEQHKVPCRPPRTGICNETRRVTKMRSETRVRDVTRFRTQYVTRTRVVTRMRDEPRLFTYQAIKHDGVYRANMQVRASFEPSTRPVESRVQHEEQATAYEHDMSFAPAGVRPERGALPAPTTFRARQLTELAHTFGKDLDRAWVAQMCTDAVVSLEAAARCAHARPRPVPAAVQARLVELFGEEPDLVLALPRVKEGVVQ